MPEADPSDTPLHVGKEGGLRRSASCEAIADRHDAPFRLAETAERDAAEPVSLPTVRWPPPAAARMTASEVLSWIAYGDARRDTETEIAKRWGALDIDRIDTALRARIAEAPYTPLDGAFSKPWFAFPYIGRQWAPSLRALRGRMRREEGCILSFHDMHEQLKRDIERMRQRDPAHGELMRAILDGELVALLADPEDAAAKLQPIDVWLFIRGMTIHARSGDLTRGDVPVAEYAALRNVKTGPVWFKTADVLRPWPARQPIEQPTPESAISSPPRDDAKRPKEGRPTNRERIFSALDTLNASGHRVHQMAPMQLVRLVAKQCGAKLKDRGWAERTVLDHVKAWRDDHPV
jgi:hypothetical protein